MKTTTSAETHPCYNYASQEIRVHVALVPRCRTDLSGNPHKYYNFKAENARGSPHHRLVVGCLTYKFN